MNTLLNNAISIRGLDKAMKVARTLIENDYQVFIQLDEFDVYIVSYSYNDPDVGDTQFAQLNEEEVQVIENLRRNKKRTDAIKLLAEDEDNYASYDEYCDSIKNKDDENGKDEWAQKIMSTPLKCDSK